MKYRVTYTAIVTRETVVEADSEEDAYNKVADGHSGYEKDVSEEYHDDVDCTPIPSQDLP